MRFFYAPEIEGNLYTLNPEQSRHCSRVLRLKNNDAILLTDGKGNIYHSVIQEIDSKRTIISVLDKTADYGKRDYHLHIAIAPTKNIDRIEWFVEKATEIGIDEITPIICKNSERKIIKHDRLERIAEAALKQSQSAYLPKINEQIPMSKFLEIESNISQKYIAHCVKNSEKQYLAQVIKKNTDTLILIGPEGDFDNSEIEKSISKEYLPISLGNSRLRTETAGIVACNLVSMINQM